MTLKNPSTPHTQLHYCAFPSYIFSVCLLRLPFLNALSHSVRISLLLQMIVILVCVCMRVCVSICKII